MASSFPGSIDSFTNPLSNSALNSPSHAGQHQDLNDAVNKVETYMGLVIVIPTSGTNCTIGATGTVTFSSVTSVLINGCFTSRYKNYRIVITGTSNSINAADLQLQWAVGGVQNTTSNYFSNIIFNTHAAGPSRTYVGGAAVAYVGQTADVAFTNTIDVMSPQAVSRTSSMTMANGFGSNTAVVGTYFSNFNATTQFDGFIFSAGGTITLSGQCTIYGYRD